MSHAAEHLVGRPALDDGATIHDHHPLHVLGDDAEIVRDQDHRHAALLDEIGDEVEDLALDGDVQRGGRLICDQQVRLAGECHGNRDALALAAGELVRIGIDAPRRIRQPDAVEQRDRLASGLRGRIILVTPQRFGHLMADRVHRIERGHRLLEDHADAVAAQTAIVGVRKSDEFIAIQPDAAADDRAVRQEAHQRECRDRLATAGLADEPQRLAALQGKADATHGLCRPAAGVEPDAEIADFDQRHGRALAHDHRSRASLGSSRSRNPSPRRLRPSTAIAIATPG